MTWSGKSLAKTNHGPCAVCGRPILYLAALFCGPDCHFDFIRNGVRSESDVPEPVMRDPEPDVPEPDVPEPDVPETPEPVVPSQGPAFFMGISSPPDEAPRKRRFTL